MMGNNLSFEPRKQIDLVQQQKDRRPDLLRQSRTDWSAWPNLPRDIHNQQNQFAAIQSFADLRHHFPPKRSVGTVNAGSIEEDDLAGRLCFLLGVPGTLISPGCGCGWSAVWG